MTTYNLHDLLEARGVPEPLRSGVLAMAAEMEALRCALKLYQHAVESGSVDVDLRAAYDAANEALA